MCPSPPYTPSGSLPLSVLSSSLPPSLPSLAVFSSQPKAAIPTSYPETVYDTAFYKRSAIKLAAPPGADPAQFERFAQPGRWPGDYPRHTPKPWWYYDEAALKAMRRMYVQSGGLVAAGWSRQRTDIVRIGEAER